MTAPPLAHLINELTKLPGVGGKSAARIAYHILKRPAAEAEVLALAIAEVKSKVFRCSVCNNMTDVEPCAIITLMVTSGARLSMVTTRGSPAVYASVVAGTSGSGAAAGTGVGVDATGVAVAHASESNSGTIIRRFTSHLPYPPA